MPVRAAGHMPRSLATGLRGSEARLFAAKPSATSLVAERSGHGRADAAIPATTDGFDPASNVCLLTIMTQERTASLHRMLGVWDGYVSIALLVDVYDEAAAEGINLLKYHGELPRAPQRITLSIVEDRGYRSPYNRFPYNVLRNVALEGCTAEYVMAADVDFVPFSSIGTSPSANLRRSLNELNVRDGAKNVLVLAAFEEVDARQGIDSREGKPSVLLANGTREQQQQQQQQQRRWWSAALKSLRPPRQGGAPPARTQ